MGALCSHVLLLPLGNPFPMTVKVGAPPNPNPTSDVGNTTQGPGVPDHQTGSHIAGAQHFQAVCHVVFVRASFVQCANGNGMCVCVCVCVCDAQSFKQINGVRYDKPPLQLRSHCSNVFRLCPVQPFLPLSTTARLCTAHASPLRPAAPYACPLPLQGSPCVCVCVCQGIDAIHAQTARLNIPTSYFICKP